MALSNRHYLASLSGSLRPKLLSNHRERPNLVYERRSKGKGVIMPDDLTDYKIAAAEARSDTKVARLEGKIDVLATSINNLGIKIDGQRSEASANRNVLVSVIVGSALAAMALMFAMFSYGASTFYNGTVVRDLVHNEITSSAQKTPANNSSTGATPVH